MNHNILLFAQVRISTDVNKIQCDKLFMDQKGAVNLKGPKFYFTFYIRNKNKKYIRLFIKLLVTFFLACLNSKNELIRIVLNFPLLEWVC